MSAILTTLMASAASVNFNFASSFGSHMVLQQAPAQATVWGFAPHSSTSAGAITVQLSGSGYNAVVQATLAPFNATADTWTAVLPAMPAKRTSSGVAEQFTLTATLGSGLSAASAVTLDDILFGEVWVCSGQSNMAFLVEMAFGGKDLVQDANNHPEIRLFTTRKLTAGTPLQELGEDTNGGQWVDGVELPWSVASNISISQNNHGGANDDNCVCAGIDPVSPPACLPCADSRGNLSGALLRTPQGCTCRPSATFSGKRSRQHATCPSVS
jgi:sialate O-acetylesterase